MVLLLNTYNLLVVLIIYFVFNEVKNIFMYVVEQDMVGLVQLDCIKNVNEINDSFNEVILIVLLTILILARASSVIGLLSLTFL